MIHSSADGADFPKRLRTLSNAELLSQVEAFAGRERLATIQILHHLNEIERRRLFLGLGHSSLFDYCVRRLKYSPSAAGRRIQAARCIRRHADVLELLRSRELSLATVALIEPIVTEGNCASILGRVRGRPYREVERIVSEQRPPVALRDRVRPVRVAVCVPSSLNAPTDALKDAGVAPVGTVGASPPGAAIAPGAGSDPEAARGALGVAPASADPCPAGEATPSGAGHTKLERRLFVQFMMTEACMKKYEEARALLSRRCPDGSFGDVIDVVLAEFIERHSPAARQRRREARRAAPTGILTAAGPTPAGTTPPADPDSNGTDHSRRRECSPRRSARHIAASVRDEIHEQHNGRCAYVAPDGTRCGSTHALQIDHIHPYAAGGSNGPSNLRLLCAAHNRYAAECTLGAHVMARFRRHE